MITLILETFHRELKLTFRKQGEWFQPFLFFIIIVGIFSLMLGKSPRELQENALGIIWTAFILGLVLSQETIYHSDHESFVLEQILLSPRPKFIIILSKILAHCLILGLPLIIIALITAYLCGIESSALVGVGFSLLLSLPSLSLLGSISAALTLSLKRGGLMLAILQLPLMAPIVLFGAAASYAACEHQALFPHFALLAAFLIMLLVLAPMASAFALEISAES